MNDVALEIAATAARLVVEEGLAAFLQAARDKAALSAGTA